jgi:hypothetical protein
MSEQLNLFQGLESDDRRSAGAIEPAEAGRGALDDFFRADPRWRSRQSCLELFDYLARFPMYSPYNGFLLFLQDPAATHLATARNWLRRYQRRIRPGARPLLVLAPRSPVLFLFDVRQTEGPPVPAGAVRPRSRPPLTLYESLVRGCAGRRIIVREVSSAQAQAEGLGTQRLTPALRKKHPELDRDGGARCLIRLEAAGGAAERFRALARELAHLFCGHLGTETGGWWSDRRDTGLACMDIESDATAFLVCHRLGLKPQAELLSAEWRGADRDLPVFSLNAVLQAAAGLEQMAKGRPRDDG